MPPGATRFYARLDRFEAECPNCGHVITPTATDGRGPARLANLGNRRAAARSTPRNASVRDLVWNPYSQRLHCPFCDMSFHAGLLLYPVKKGAWITTAPPDCLPNARQRQEIRAQGRGWWAIEPHSKQHEVNVSITAECSCPDRGTSRTCPIHGWQEAKAPPAARTNDAAE
jgi:hypothetical protein